MAYSMVPVCPDRSRLPLSISSLVPKSDIIALGLAYQLYKRIGCTYHG